MTPASITPDETWTMDDFLAAAIEVTDPDRRIWGFVDPEGSYFTSIVFIRALAGIRSMRTALSRFSIRKKRLLP